MYYLTSAFKSPIHSARMHYRDWCRSQDRDPTANHAKCDHLLGVSNRILWPCRQSEDRGRPSLAVLLHRSTKHRFLLHDEQPSNETAKALLRLCWASSRPRSVGSISLRHRSVSHSSNAMSTQLHVISGAGTLGSGAVKDVHTAKQYCDRLHLKVTPASTMPGYVRLMCLAIPKSSWLHPAQAPEGPSILR